VVNATISDDMPRPTERDAALAVHAGLGVESLAVERFPTGIVHYVYDVTTAAGRRVVARLATEDSAHLLAGGVYWHERLRGVGAPLPALLYADLAPASGFAFMLLERLPGKDLALVYDQMTHAQRQALAVEIVALQRSVASLPRASGFGFARSYDDPNLLPTWLDVVLADLERSRQRLSANGVAPVAYVERVRQRVMEIAQYLRAVAPVAFLDDTTTKNVLIHDGALSGVVDTDLVCFGDPLFTLALTRLALRAHAMESDYANHWRDLLALDADRQRALTVYTAVFCVGFMSEIGERFNRDVSPPIDYAYLRRLEHILDDLLTNG
jgi:aminoglycoside phosphotransferase (APT) family kinase protein